ncbi:hypothetical protein AGABI2DRAFT_209217 [Agaricus bisporus var. bisporus H97]|uniref:hypothetical protein n=1 Tax=Agaricus bisporus var. bisporus (strain H97 / ATCC MYA-4626 / FGSC 10389) TaxID=936046 RepID=UPI00029F7C29|nr:hypothetical protein AGABI2DRAFT_209217 [Agaricus bisporus var. bisporus H97]EKV44839.1 hypothetical protein AGABI2DRAFT_209217 [Agaricus bisporus var. bisporus H97]
MTRTFPISGSLYLPVIKVNLTCDPTRHSAPRFSFLPQRLKLSSMLSNPRNFVINNSHFTDQSFNVFSNGPSGIDVLLKASTSEAAYDSSARDPPPRCFPGTREQYIQDIIHWALSNDDQASQPLFWMKGLAGVGKSALAQSCVELLNGLGKPCAAYFFSVNGKMKHGSFFNTVAYQLSTIFPQYRDLVDSKIRRDNTLVDKSMASQFKTLIIEPLQDLENQGKSIGFRVPIFVDGLDECESQDAQCQIIELIASSARDGSIPLCWAFFSRPERHIEATFGRTNVSSICYHTILPVSRDADGEIELYLRVGFENVLRECNLPAAPGTPWPSIEDMKVLVDASSGLFVYASTILRYISHSTSLGPERPLREVLDVIFHRQNLANRGVSVSPFEELDKVYMLIMQRIPSRAKPVVQLLCAILCFCGPLSYGDGRGAAVLGNLLRLSAVEFRTTCQQLSSVLHFQNQGQQLSFHDVDTTFPFNHINPCAISKLCGIVRAQLGGSIAFYHKSFFDFLIDPKRSGNFCVKSAMAENALFEHCFDLRLELEASYVINGSGMCNGSTSNCY